MSEEKKQQTKEKEQRNIYEKMAVVKTKLVGLKKGGKNDYSGYSYFELGDILPVLTPALQEERLYMKTEFSVTEQIAKLIIVDIDVPDSTISFEIRFAECALKGAHEIQNLGAAQTYTRRYLIMTAFDIAEADIVDAGEEKEEKKPERKPYRTQGTRQPPEEPKTVELDVAKLKRGRWEQINRLPKDQQTKWINMCKGANPEALIDIYNNVTEILNAEANQKEPPKEETEEHKKRVEELKDKLLTLIEKLPTESQSEWFEATQNSNSISELCDFHSHLTKVIEEAKTQKPPKTEPATPKGKLANQPVNPQELDIY
jgi:uncharacterized protein YdcH (DUF465 family)